MNVDRLPESGFCQKGGAVPLGRAKASTGDHNATGAPS
jgi:hypothetical protein